MKCHSKSVQHLQSIHMMNFLAICIIFFISSILFPTVFAESNSEMIHHNTHPNKPNKMEYIPPLKQLDTVDDLHEITCKEEQQLIFKKDVWSPACVNEDSIPKLVERGWANSHDPKHMNMMMPKEESTKSDTKTYATTDANLFENITVMEPNSMRWFYYPESPTYEKSDTAIPKNTDTHKLFLLIRLPEWMGGNANDTSAYRAYSAKTLDDSCVVKYWPNDGRQRLENPCQGAMYRVIDGAMTVGKIHRSIPMTALPYLELSMDENGMLYAEPPKWAKNENGVIGYGRNISIDEFRANSKFLVDSFRMTHPEYPSIPMEFVGYELSEINPHQFKVDLSYIDFLGDTGKVFMSISKSPVGTASYWPKSNSDTWKIGDTTITINEYTRDVDSIDLEKYRNYEIRFKDDGFYYAINGKDLEFIKKEIVRNFFPEYEQHEKDNVMLDYDTINLDGNIINVQVADTEPKRIRGLMFQEQLPYNQGMLFVFDEPGIRSLWMPNMEFPLDMIWFDENKNVVHIETDIPPCNMKLTDPDCPSVIPDAEALYVLEATSGFAEKFGITKDSSFSWITSNYDYN